MKRMLFLAITSLVFAGSARADRPDVRTLADMIAAGHYGYVDELITARHFPVRPERFTTKNLQVIHYGAKLTSQDVLTDLECRGLRPAVIEELLAYAAEHPEAQKDHTIVAPGSIWNQLMPRLDMEYVNPRVYDAHGTPERMRVLRLQYMKPEYHYPESVRFLAAPK